MLETQQELDAALFILFDHRRRRISEEVLTQALSMDCEYEYSPGIDHDPNYHEVYRAVPGSRYWRPLSSPAALYVGAGWAEKRERGYTCESLLCSSNWQAVYHTSTHLSSGYSSDNLKSVQ